MKLIPSNEALNIVEYGLLSLRQTTQGIRKSLGQDIRKDKVREAEKNRLNVQQFDAVQKKDAEKIVEAKQSNNFIKGGVNNIMRGAKSIFQGLLSAAGWILLDYLVQKLPEVIIIVNKVTRIVQKLWDAVQQTWSNIQSVFKEISDVFRQFAENIKSWDFLDSEGKLRKEFDEFTGSATKLKTDLGNSFDDISKELTNLGNMSQDEYRQAREQLGLDTKPTTPMIPVTPPPVTPPPIERPAEQKPKPQIPATPPKPVIVTPSGPWRQPPKKYDPKAPLISQTGAKPPGFAIGEKAGYSTSRGRIHAGRDIPAAYNTALVVPSDSVIQDSGWEKNYGNWIAFTDANGLEHFYGHMNEASPYKKGDKVSTGTVIGRVGSTGERSTGPHLHWELGKVEGITGTPRSNVIDPLDFGFAPTAPFSGKVVGPVKRVVVDPKISANYLGPSILGDPKNMPSLEIAKMPKVIPFDVAMLDLNTKDALTYGEQTMAVTVANAVPELPASELEAVKIALLNLKAINRQ
jgi:murein DD-endopeptidase MepM/ murein hydrolase activator NlpD